MIARLLPAADLAIDARAHEALGDRWAEKQMIDAQSGIALPGISEVIPKGVDALVRMQLAHRIGPAPSDEASVGVAHLGPEERIIKPALRLIDVKIGRHHIVVAGENNRRGRGEQRLGMFGQAREPAEFVIELRAGRWIAVGKVKAANQHAIDGRLEVATVCVVWIAGKAPTTLAGIQTARENGDAIPALLAVPDRAVARLADRGLWKFLLGRLQFLKAHDIGLGFDEPAQEHREATIDAVDVEGCDFQ